MQFHEVIRAGVIRIGSLQYGVAAMEAMLEAKQVRARCASWLASPGTRTHYVHLRMLDIARAHSFRFDAVQMPLNVMDAFTSAALRMKCCRCCAGEGIAPLGMVSAWGPLHFGQQHGEADGGAALLPEPADCGSDYGD